MELQVTTARGHASSGSDSITYTAYDATFCQTNILSLYDPEEQYLSLSYTTREILGAEVITHATLSKQCVRKSSYSSSSYLNKRSESLLFYWETSLFYVFRTPHLSTDYKNFGEAVDHFKYQEAVSIN